MGQASGQQVLDQIIFRAPVVLREGGQGHLHGLAEFIFPRGGYGTQAYHGQQLAPDRHGQNCNRTGVLSQRGFGNSSGHVDGKDTHARSSQFRALVAMGSESDA